MIKGFYHSYKIFTHLVNVIKYRAAELHIIGEGPESNKLKQLVKKYRLSNFIKFIGQVPKHDIGTYYKDSNLFVSGSLSESMPAMYLEAMAASLPMVIASNTTSLELERNNFGGTVFPQKNAISMADNIHLLLTNPDLYNSYSIRNYSLSKSKYNFKKQLNKLTDLLYSTVGLGKYENH
ncbi:MAG: glycosyltransferase [Thiothrix sp.]|nr:MAG: glycosyltransferase [Thiothrix sp.]